ncbi:hypothetical protein Bpfe_000718, partial [Biomphalaria pfeifferi]
RHQVDVGMSPVTSVTSIVETDRKTMEEMGMTTMKTRHFNVVMFVTWSTFLEPTPDSQEHLLS